MNTIVTFWLSVLGWLTALTAASMGIRNVTKDLDDDLTEAARLRFAHNLSKATAPGADWMMAFSQLFTKVFGPKHLSWRCLSRSLALSGATFALIGLATGPFIIPTSRLAEAGYSPFLIWAAWLFALSLVGIVLHGLADYLLLWLTRLVINTGLSAIAKVGFVFGVTSTVVVSVFLAILFSLVVDGVMVSPSMKDGNADSAVLWLFFMIEFPFGNFPPQVGTIAFVVFATSFATTAWIILHVVSVWIVRVVPTVFSVLNVQNKPIRAVGLVTSALVWLLGLVLAAVHFRFH